MGTSCEDGTHGNGKRPHADKNVLKYLSRLLVSIVFTVVLFLALVGILAFLLSVLWPPAVIYDA
jgi:hypothetical protein